MGWFDKGILGGAQGDNGSMGGLLAGAKPSGWDIASMIASGLQDVNAGYRGQPGGNLDTTMQDMQTHHMHRALMEGLQSPDPTIRQKAYSAAAMLGIDTKPIQQQQATSQLPAFLASMKPQDLTMGSNSAPLNNGSAITTPPINFQSPGKSISDAIGSAPPELQGQYAPKLIDEELKGPKYQGAAGGLYQLPGLDGGTPTQVVAPEIKAPTTRTVRRGLQTVTEEFDKNTGGWKQVGSGAAFKPDKAPTPTVSIGAANPAAMFRRGR